jgi:hypothetical protein
VSTLPPIPSPRGSKGTIPWAVKNKGAVTSAVDRLNRLAEMRARLTSKPSAAGMDVGLIEAEQNILLEIPLKFRSAITDAATTVGVALATTAAVNTTPYGYTTAAQADAIVERVNQLRVDVLALKEKLNAVLEELRKNGQNA